MNDEPLFVKVEKPTLHGADKWTPLLEALASGDAFRIPLKQTSIAQHLGRRAKEMYPGRRLRTQRVDASHTTVWLVDER